ncbi:MAG: polysaccharide deacetylase family protein [Candidatus Omnitrophota bacterium]|nr:MAG: polysaccharide deacetylase family protein [Candidatus Omnitrophota bacterium]
MKRIILTFDDGPNPPYTSIILNILKKYRIKAIFFLLGHNVKLHPKVALMIKEEGHIIGNHTFSHKDLKKLPKTGIKKQIIEAEKVFLGVLGIKPAFFRAPYGFYDKKAEDIIKKRGYRIVNWDIDPEDWKNPPAKIIAERVISQAKHKSIIVLHDGSNIRQARPRRETTAALEIIMKKLKNKGFVFDTGIFL